LRRRFKFVATAIRCVLHDVKHFTPFEDGDRSPNPAKPHRSIRSAISKPESLCCGASMRNQWRPQAFPRCDDFR
jgi:hypothetical protein